MKIFNFFAKKKTETYIWHASNYLFDFFDQNKIGAHASVYGHGFYFSCSQQGAKNAFPNQKYVYQVLIDEKELTNIIQSAVKISNQSKKIQSAAKRLKSYAPLTYHDNFLDANGSNLPKAAETYANDKKTIYSRDVLMQLGIKGYYVEDGPSETHRLYVIYDPSIIKIVAIHFI